MPASEEITSCLSEEVELEGGATFTLEKLEELRLTLRSFLRPRTLSALDEVRKILDKKPMQTEPFAYFVRNSQFGAECRYARLALEQFKKHRIDRTIELMETCLAELKEMKSTGV